MRIGDIEVARVVENEGAFSPVDFLLPGFTAELLKEHAWLQPEFVDRENRVMMSFHSYVVRTPRHTILIDGCVGNGKERPARPMWHRQEGPYLDRLAAAGVRPEEIDVVFCTHLHADHVGWNTRLRDGRWVPTFPNAKYLFSREENAFWGAKPHAAYVDSVLPVLEAGQAVLVEGSHAIAERMMIDPAPGHTPGHVILKLAERGERAVFCGDVIHHPLQVYAPHWNHAACQMADQSRATRRRVLEDCAAQGALLFPTHFGAPHVVSIQEAAGRLSCTFRASSA